MKELGEIKMDARPGGVVVIDIEGIIGIPEDWQFDGETRQGESAEKVATFGKFRQTVDAIAGIQASRVKVNIRSMGGNVNDALLIYEALCSLDAQVETRCYGYVASAATIIAQAAGEGMRYVSSDSLYLIHNATTVVDGNSADVMRTAGLLGKTDDRIAAIYALRSGRPVENFVELMGRDGGHGEWLSPEEVVEAGLADKIEHVSPLKNAQRKIMGAFRALGESAFRGYRSSLWATAMNFDDPMEERVDTLEKKLDSIGKLEGAQADLINKIKTLEQENTRLKVEPTTTLPKEDPAIEPRAARPNEAAYCQDVETFRGTVS